MISEDFALKQLSRLALYRGFDALSKEENSELRKDFVWAVQTAITEEICERVMDDIVSAPIRELPKAAYIRTAMNEENERWSVDSTAAQIEQWKREAAAEQAQWRQAVEEKLPAPLPQPNPDPKGYEKVLEPILAKYRAGAWRLDPDGARQAALMQMWLTVNRGNKTMLMNQPGKMPQHLWDELCALKAKFKAGRLI